MNEATTLGELTMGCNSDYMAANGYERELSRVACLLEMHPDDLKA